MPELDFDPYSCEAFPSLEFSLSGDRDQLHLTAHEQSGRETHLLSIARQGYLIRHQIPGDFAPLPPRDGNRIPLHSDSAPTRAPTPRPTTDASLVQPATGLRYALRLSPFSDAMILHLVYDPNNHIPLLDILSDGSFALAQLSPRNISRAESRGLQIDRATSTIQLTPPPPALAVEPTPAPRPDPAYALTGDQFDAIGREFDTPSDEDDDQLTLTFRYHNFHNSWLLYSRFNTTPDSYLRAFPPDYDPEEHGPEDELPPLLAIPYAQWPFATIPTVELYLDHLGVLRDERPEREEPQDDPETESDDDFSFDNEPETESESQF